MKRSSEAWIDLTDPTSPRLNFKSYRADFLHNIKSFQHNQRINVTLETLYNDRSLDQNAFYWKIFIHEQIECFKEFWGETYSKKEMHEWNKSNFWGEEKVIEATGEVVRTPASSTDKSTVEWEEKLENIRQWFRQKFEWEISYPDRQKKIRFR